MPQPFLFCLPLLPKGRPALVTLPDQAEPIFPYDSSSLLCYKVYPRQPEFPADNASRRFEVMRRIL